MLDQSGLSSSYLRFTSKHLQLLYRGLTLGHPLAPAQWRSLLGQDSTEQWLAHGLLLPGNDDRLTCCLRLIVVGHLRFAVDYFHYSLPQRVHIGGDSLNMMEFLERHATDRGGRMLDVGTGSGLQLLAASRHRDAGLGLDINPRAVRVASLNVKLNQATHCSVEERDAFDPEWKPDPFRLVTWNLPFMFFPDNEVADNLDGHGGHLGIALTLAFVERLVDLLAPEGQAWLLTSAPVMLDGRNMLEIELQQRAQRCRLDIATYVLQRYWDRRHRQFHRNHQIRSFESVMVQIRPGNGRFQRTPPNPFRRSVDWLRAIMYERAG